MTTETQKHGTGSLARLIRAGRTAWALGQGVTAVALSDFAAFVPRLWHPAYVAAGVRRSP